MSADRKTRGSGGQTTAAGGVNDDDPSNPFSWQTLKTLIVNLQLSLDEHKKTMKKKMEDQKTELLKKIEGQSQLINEKSELMTKNIQKLEDDLKKELHKEVKSLETYIDQEVKLLITRVEKVEERVLKLEEQHNESQAFNYDTTAIIINLPSEANEDLDKKVDDFIKIGIKVPDVDILRTLRLQSKTKRPGLVKVQFRNIEQKIKVLRNKSNLESSVRYSRVFIRSSKPHAERIAEYNMKALLSNIPDLGRKYRLTGNGKLAPKSPEQGQQRPAYHSPISNSEANGLFPGYSYSPYDRPPSVYNQSFSH